MPETASQPVSVPASVSPPWGQIFAFITCTRVKWEQGAVEMATAEGVTPDVIRQRYSVGWHVDGATGAITYDDDGSGDYNPTSDTVRSEDAVEEHGWVDRGWSPYVLHESRNDAPPVVDCPEEDDERLAEECRAALEWLDGGAEDNGDGTFYAREGYTPFQDNFEGWEYSYALHFVRKFYGPDGWTEEPWIPPMAMRP